MALRAALDDFRAAVDGAVKAASVPGQPTEPQTVAGLSDMGLEELKRLLPGSVLELDDGSFAFLPLTHAVIGQAGGEIKLLVKTGDAAAGIQRSLAWAGENIKQIAVGVLSTASKDGANTAPLKIASLPAKLRVKAGDTLTELEVLPEGGASFAKGVKESLAAVGGAWQSWTGGVVEAPLIATPPAPTLDEALAVGSSMGRAHLVAGSADGAAEFLRPAKIEALGLLDPLGIGTAAAFAAHLARRPTAERQLAVVLASKTAVIGADPPDDVTPLLRPTPTDQPPPKPQQPPPPPRSGASVRASS